MGSKKSVSFGASVGAAPELDVDFAQHPPLLLQDPWPAAEQEASAAGPWESAVRQAPTRAAGDYVYSAKVTKPKHRRQEESGTAGAKLAPPGAAGGT